MKIGVIGGGSIGLLVSSYLSKKHSIRIYVRRHAQRDAININGIYRDGIQYKNNIQAVPINEMEQEDVYIICVKQTHVKDVLAIMNTVVCKKPVIFLQNGMGHLEQVQHVHYPVYAGIVEHGAIRTADYCIKHVGKGLIKVASYSGNADMLSYLVNEMDENPFPVHLFEDWESLLKDKLIINAVINPLTALFRVENGYILTMHHMKRLAYLLCEEAVSVLDLDFEKSWKNIETVVYNTSENISSMLSDINNYQETEIDAITGYILRNSKAEIPNTAFIYNSIKAIEELYSTKSK